MGVQLVDVGIIIRSCGYDGLTWMKAVEMMIPVPNCFRMVKTRVSLLGRIFWSMMGPKTPMFVSECVR